MSHIEINVSGSVSIRPGTEDFVSQMIDTIESIATEEANLGIEEYTELGEDEMEQRRSLIIHHAATKAVALAVEQALGHRSADSLPRMSVASNAGEGPRLVIEGDSGVSDEVLVAIMQQIIRHAGAGKHGTYRVDAITVYRSGTVSDVSEVLVTERAAHFYNAEIAQERHREAVEQMPDMVDPREFAGRLLEAIAQGPDRIATLEAIVATLISQNANGVQDLLQEPSVAKHLNQLPSSALPEGVEIFIRESDAMEQKDDSLPGCSP